MKRWKIGKPDSVLSDRIAEKMGISKLSADILVSRNIDSEELADEFFGRNSDVDRLMMYDCFAIGDMDKAVELITEAIENNHKICIYGDYDCDGIMSTSALYNYLISIGADVFYFINERSEGYGLNENNIRKIHHSGADMIITVDNGISAVNEADVCLELGMKLIITDHHIPPEVLPQADAVVNPHIDMGDGIPVFRDLCGCGVVMKLIAAMEEGSNSFALEFMADFAAIATVGDVMPLVGENRNIVKHGIHYMQNSENPGLNALMKLISAKRPFRYTAQNISFSLVPRINAVGRMTSAMRAVELFTMEDADEAKELAEELFSLNETRREIENAIMSEVQNSLAENAAKTASPIVVAAGENWHSGVIGIAASKIMDNTGKPTYIISLNDGVGTGSARADGDYSVYDSLCLCSDLLSKFGGHKGAGGFTIPEKNIEEFEQRLRKAAEDFYFEPVIDVVRKIEPSELTITAVEKMSEELEPFGEKNDEPVFLVQNAEITAVSPMSDGKYTRVSISYGGVPISFPMFTVAFDDFPYDVGDSINIAAVPGINEFNGRKSVTLSVKELRKSGIVQDRLMNAEKTYREFLSGKLPESRIAAAMIPSKEEFAEIYRAISSDREVSSDYILYRYCDRINLCKLNIILDVFSETGLVDYNRGNGKLRKNKAESRVDLQSAPSMLKLKGVM